MEKVSVLILGCDGMLGHKLYQVLNGDPSFITYGTSRRFNNPSSIFFDPLKNFKDLKAILIDLKIDVVINCIGVLNHSKNQTQLIDINSIFPKKLELLLLETEIKIIHLSTDCVFNGEEGNYSEKSLPDAKDLYGKSKFLGELNNSKDLTIRCSIIGPELKSDHNTGLLNWFLKEITNKNYITGYANVYWSGTSTLKLSQLILYSIKNNLNGLIHVSVPRKISKLSLLELFTNCLKANIKIEPSEELQYDKSLISVDNQLSINSEYKEIIEEMFEDIYKNQSLYDYYKLNNYDYDPTRIKTIS